MSNTDQTLDRAERATRAAMKAAGLNPSAPATLFDCYMVLHLAGEINADSMHKAGEAVKEARSKSEGNEDSLLHMVEQLEQRIASLELATQSLQLQLDAARGLAV